VSIRTAQWLCGTALVVGLLGDQLLRSEPWGVGAALWLILSIGTALVVARTTRAAGGAALMALLLAAGGFAACLAWRDAPTLKGWNVLATGAALTLGLLAVGNVRLRVASLAEYVTGVARAALWAAVGPIVLVGRDLIGRERAAGGASPRLRALVVGIVITIPILILFGALLTSADPVFDRLTRFLIVWDFEQLLSHLLLIGFLSWMAAGYLRSVVTPSAALTRPVAEVPRPGWDALAVGIPLGALALLFLAFIVVQARYLFGGEDLIRTTVGLTYAEYARRGFFELVAVAGLVLPLLMAAEWVLGASDRFTVRVYRGLAATILVLVGCIIASAAMRLRLYHDAYGLTHDRLYAAAVMVWIASALAWFGATVLRGQRHRFVFGAVMAGLAVVAGMNVLDPDVVIARANLAHAARGHELDTSYLTRLSADATATLAAALPALSTAERCAIGRHLAQEERRRRESDWRSWSLSRSRADGAVREIDVVGAGCPTSDPPDAATEPAPGI